MPRRLAAFGKRLDDPALLVNYIDYPMSKSIFCAGGGSAKRSQFRIKRLFFYDLAGMSQNAIRRETTGDFQHGPIVAGDSADPGRVGANCLIARRIFPGTTGERLCTPKEMHSFDT